MYEFHKDKARYFSMQREVTHQYLIPFIRQYFKKPLSECKILEIGCAEAGVLKAFLDENATGVGIELLETRATLAKQFLAEDISAGRVEIINKNIYDVAETQREEFRFDLIVLKDVIEHIPDQSKFIARLSAFLKPGGMVFFAYPPWQMPFGGHQQICNHTLLKVMPWIHLLPVVVYKFLLRTAGESKHTIDELLEIKETGISMGQMYHILLQNNFKIIGEKFWFVNPIYKYKFGLKPRVVFNLISKIPYFRNFCISAHYIIFHKG